MKITTKLQNVIMFTKVAALIIVIILGIVALSQGSSKLSKLNYLTILVNRNKSEHGCLALNNSIGNTERKLLTGSLQVKNGEGYYGKMY